MKADDDIVRFVNRSRDDYHLAILSILDERGSCPTTNLMFRAEMNDSQVKKVLDYLSKRKMVTRTALDIHDRSKMMYMHYSMTCKNVVSITEKGRLYLHMLRELHSQINWKLRVSEHQSLIMKPYKKKESKEDRIRRQREERGNNQWEE